jgi:hypothetical protein
VPIRDRPFSATTPAGGGAPARGAPDAQGPAKPDVEAADAPAPADPEAVATLASSRFRAVLGLVRDASLAPAAAPVQGASALATRAAQLRGDDPVDRDAAIATQLAVLAGALRDADTPGVELWTTVLAAAAEANLARADLSPQERLDATVAQTTAVFVGRPAGGYLHTFEKLARFIPGATDPLAASMRARSLALPDVGDVLPNGYNLDPAAGDDFAPAFRDGSKGQIGHTHFYVFIGYAVGRKDPLLAHMPNTYHETVDPSSTHKTEADWLAGAWGIEVGRLVRLLRDAGEPDAALRALPSLVRGAFGAAGAGADAVAAEARSVVERHLHKPVEGGLLATTFNALASGLASLASRVGRRAD